MVPRGTQLATWDHRQPPIADACRPTVLHCISRPRPVIPCADLWRLTTPPSRAHPPYPRRAGLAAKEQKLAQKQEAERQKAQKALEAAEGSRQQLHGAIGDAERSHHEAEERALATRKQVGTLEEKAAGAKQYFDQLQVGLLGRGVAVPCVFVSDGGGGGSRVRRQHRRLPLSAMHVRSFGCLLRTGRRLLARGRRGCIPTCLS